MATRDTYTSASPGAIGGDAYMNNVAAHIGRLYDAIQLKPTSITNSGNDYTLTVDPVLTADVADGMGFFILPNANNSGAARMRVGSGTYYNLLKINGAALASGEFNTTQYYYVVFLNGGFFILSQINVSSVVSVAQVQTFTASGTWTKPSGLSDSAIVIVELWGAGGGGGRGGSAAQGAGGGGGAYFQRIMRAGDLTSTVAVTVGTGGAGASVNNTAGTGGGTTQFGGYAYAFGGGGGGPNNPSMGGGGGGAQSVGAVGNSAMTEVFGGGPTFIQPGALTTGSGAQCYGGGLTNIASTVFSSGSEKGGAAGASSATSATDAGISLWGGGGGASHNHNAGGSVYGGSGGAFGVAGSARGGGGGGCAAGGRGEVVVRIVP